MRSPREQFVATMGSLLESDPRVALVLADISADRFATRAATHRDRVINVGIREQTMIGVSAGLALAGLRPVAHSYSAFLIERPFEQIKLDLGHQDLGAVLVGVAAGYEATREGRTHQCPGDIALLDTIPGWTVHAPGHPEEVDRLLRAAVIGDGRVYLRLSERSNARPHHGAGRLVELRRGARATVVAVGPMLDPVLEATAGLDVTVLYSSTLRPLDTDTLVGSLGEGAAPSVVLVEPALAGTSTAKVAAALAHVPHRILALGVADPELRRYGNPADHDLAHRLDSASIRGRIASWLEPA